MEKGQLYLQSRTILLIFLWEAWSPRQPFMSLIDWSMYTVLPYFTTVIILKHSNLFQHFIIYLMSTFPVFHIFISTFILIKYLFFFSLQIFSWLLIFSFRFKASTFFILVLYANLQIKGFIYLRTNRVWVVISSTVLIFQSFSFFSHDEKNESLDSLNSFKNFNRMFLFWSRKDSRVAWSVPLK